MAQNQSKSKDEWPSRQRPIHKVTSAIRSVLCASDDNGDEEKDNLKKNNRFYGRFHISVFRRPITLSMRFTSAEFWIGPLSVLITITMIVSMMILYILTIA